jgi:hypothetical protein
MCYEDCVTSARFTPPKGVNPQDVVDIGNVGTEDMCYLEHIQRNYGSLAEVTFFLQGNPFEDKMTERTLVEDIKRAARGDVDAYYPLVPLSSLILDESGYPNLYEWSVAKNSYKFETHSCFVQAADKRLKKLL